MKFLKILVCVTVVLLAVIVLGFTWLVYATGGFSPSQEAMEEQAIRENKPELCNRLPENNITLQPRRTCLTNVAVALKNARICYDYSYDVTEIRTGLDFAWCYQEVAVKNKDVVVCDELKDLLEELSPQGDQSNESALIDCYKNVGGQTKDVRVCDQLRDIRKEPFNKQDARVFEDAVRECYVSVATWTNDFSVCERISANDTKIQCLLNAPGTTPALCGKLLDASAKHACYLRYCGMMADPVSEIECLDQALDEEYEVEMEAGTYANDVHGFSITVPDDVIIEERDDYIRLQNYSPDTDSFRLAPGEYYVEVRVFSGASHDGTCEEAVLDGKSVTIGDMSGYRGLGHEGGDAGGKRFALCLESTERQIWVNATENSEKGPIANAILDSFRLKR